MWLLEGTAEWAEDEIHAATAGATFGYPDWRDRFWQEWGVGGLPFTGVPGDNERTPQNISLWYGSSVLLKWWTEHLGGPSLIKELIAPGLAGRNAKGRLVGVIERRSDTGDFPHELLRASVGAYLMDGPAPYNLKRGADMGPGLKLLPPDATGGRFDDYDPPTGRITVTTSEIESFGALFRRIRASAGDRPLTPKPLFIAVNPVDRYDVRAALVEVSERSAVGGSHCWTFALMAAIALSFRVSPTTSTRRFLWTWSR